MEKRYMKVWVNHEDPQTGLKWMSTEYIPVRRGIHINWTKVVEGMMAVATGGYIAMWLWWAFTVAIPQLIK